MDWPPYSPDLNPIENIQALLKRKINENHPELLLLQNAEALPLLHSAALKAWEELEEEMLNKLAINMRKRCQAVINAQGWYTKY